MNARMKYKLTDSPSHGSLVIIGRRWRDRANGNTYHTAQIVVNGETVHRTGRAYGYDSQYVESACVWLEAEGYIAREKYPHGGSEPLWRYCKERGIALTCVAVDLPARKDLDA